MSNKVTRLRRFLTDHAVPASGESSEAQLRSAFQLHEFNCSPALQLDQSPEARALREINRIASWYGWGSEIVRFLDGLGAGSTSALSIDQVEQLRDRMVRLERCAQDGCDAPDSLPAR
jgi:hypothetical protein